jgi:hypothetical protein
VTGVELGACANHPVPGTEGESRGYPHLFQHVAQHLRQCRNEWGEQPDMSRPYCNEVGVTLRECRLPLRLLQGSQGAEDFLSFLGFRNSRFLDECEPPSAPACRVSSRGRWMLR